MIFPLAALGESITLRCGAREAPRVAITIDDCYDRTYIEAAMEPVVISQEIYRYE